MLCLRPEVLRRSNEGVDRRNARCFIGVLRRSSRGDASLDRIAPDDLGRDAHDGLVTHINARDLFLEPPWRTGHAPRPRAHGLANASLAGLLRSPVAAVRIRHARMLRGFLSP